MSTEDIKKRVDDLGKRYATAVKKKAELHGQLDAKKAELAELAKEIKNAGYDPKKIREEKEKLEQELVQLLAAAELEIGTVETALATYDKK